MFEDLRKKFPDTRPSEKGRVPQNESYPNWLKKNPDMQTEALGNKNPEMAVGSLKPHIEKFTNNFTFQYLIYNL